MRMSVLAVLAACVPAMASGQTHSSSAMQAPPSMHGTEAPYIAPSELPDTVAILPTPPAAGSAEQAADAAAYQSTRTLSGSARWTLATHDAELDAPTLAADFSCAAGVSLTQQTVPALFRIMDRSKADVSVIYSKPKKFYDRQRPFVGNELPICVARDQKLAANGSYPSGHATIGDSLALILAEAAPDRATQILARGRVFGESRVVCGVHWPSDVEAGFLAASAMVAALHADADFRADVASLRGEIAAAPKLTDTGACAAQADAASHPVLFR